MIIEILYPEICNLFGDTGNIRFLKQCLPDAQFVETHLLDTPKFVTDEVSLVYMGSMSESSQEKVIEKLSPYKNELLKCIGKNVVMLFTGNACEVLCDYIEAYDGRKIDGLKILDFYAVREQYNRYNCCVYANFKSENGDIEIEGFKSQFTQGFYENGENNAFLSVERGQGFNKDSRFEGLRKNNLFATYLLGPMLVINPEFTKYLFKKMGVKNPQLVFEEDLKKAFDVRLAEFKDPKVAM